MKPNQPPPPPPQPERIWLGVLLMIVSSLASGAVGGFSKYAEQTVTAYQLLFIQNLLGTVCLFPVIFFTRGWQGFKTYKFGTHLIRDITGVASYLLFFLVVTQISLVDAMLLLNTGPLFVPFIVWIWMRYRPPLRMFWGIIIGFIGVVLVLHPGKEAFNPAMFLGLLSGLCVAIAYVGLRILSQTEWPYLTVFYYFLISAILFLPLAIWLWKPAGLLPWLAIIGNSIAVLAVILCITAAFMYGRVMVLSVLSYLAIIWSGIIDWIFWDHVPGVTSIIGAFLVILGGILSIFLRGQAEHSQHLKN